MTIDLGTYRIFSTEIVNHNTLGMCCEKTCSRPYSEFISIKLNGMVLVIPVCKKHANELEGVV